LRHLFILFLHWTGIWPTRRQRSRSEKGDWLTGRRCVNKALGRHSRSLECLFRGIRDRATRSEVKCSSYTSWIIKVKNTDSSKEFKFLFSGPAMWSDFLWLLGQRTGCRLLLLAQ